MLCSSCGAKAKSCDWCVSYAHLTGGAPTVPPASTVPAWSAGVLTAEPVAEPSPTSSAASGEHEVLLGFLLDFTSASRQPPTAPAPAKPSPSQATPAPAAGGPPVTVSRPTHFGQVWQPSARAPGVAAHAVAARREILPVRHHRPRAKRALVGAAALAICGVAIGALTLSGQHSASPGAGQHPAGSLQARTGHPQGSVALTTVPARFVMAPKPAR